MPHLIIQVMRHVLLAADSRLTRYASTGLYPHLAMFAMFVVVVAVYLIGCDM